MLPYPQPTGHARREMHPQAPARTRKKQLVKFCTKRFRGNVGCVATAP